MKCPHCGRAIPVKLIKSEAGRLSAKKRKTVGKSTGRPKRLVVCDTCGKSGGTAEMRRHKH